MTQRIKVRQLVEFEVEVDDREGWEFEMADFEREVSEGELDSGGAVGEVKVVYTEIVSREHIVNYVFDCDLVAEKYLLLADGEDVFESRDHDEVVREWGRRTGTEVTFTRDATLRGRGGVFLSYGDPDESWAIINGNRNKNKDGE